MLHGVARAEHVVGPQARKARELANVCAGLLNRYGVVFRAVLQRESLLPPWRDLLRALRRMEDRGEVLGGRFVDGFTGEQFALPEAEKLLRLSQGPARRAAVAVIAGTDPLDPDSDDDGIAFADSRLRYVLAILA